MTCTSVQQLSPLPHLRPSVAVVCQNCIQIEEVSVLPFLQVVGKFSSLDWQSDWSTASYRYEHLFQTKSQQSML